MCNNVLLTQIVKTKQQNNMSTYSTELSSISVIKRFHAYYAYHAKHANKDEKQAWIDFICLPESESDEHVYLSRCSSWTLLSKCTRILTSLSAHTEPISDTIFDARTLFIAMRPDINICLDLVYSAHPKALRMVVEAGISAWSQTERIAAIIASVMVEDWTYNNHKLRNRLLASIHIQSKLTVLDHCISLVQSKDYDTVAQLSNMHKLRKRFEPHFKAWYSNIESNLSVYLPMHISEEILRQATEFDLDAIDYIHANHLQRNIDIEVCSAEYKFISADGVFSKENYCDWIFSHDSFMSESVIYHIHLVKNVEYRNVTPPENVAIEYFSKKMYGRSWIRAKQKNASRPPVDDLAFIKESMIFIAKFRTKQPDIYMQNLPEITEIES